MAGPGSVSLCFLSEGQESFYFSHLAFSPGEPSPCRPTANREWCREDGLAPSHSFLDLVPMSYQDPEHGPLFAGSKPTHVSETDRWRLAFKLKISGRGGGGGEWEPTAPPGELSLLLPPPLSADSCRVPVTLSGLVLPSSLPLSPALCSSVLWGNQDATGSTEDAQA